MPLRDLLYLAAPYRHQLFLFALLSTAGSLLTLAIPWLGGQMISGMISREAGNAGTIAMLLFGAMSAVALLNFTAAHLSGATAARLLADLRQRIYRQVQSLPLDYHENRRRGDTLALMTYELAQLSNFLTSTATSFPGRLLTATGATILMLRIDIRLGLAIPLLVPAFYFILKVVGRRMRGLAQAIQQAEADMMSIAEENLEMLPAIKAFAREEPEARRYGLTIDLIRELSLRQTRILAALGPLIGLAAAGSAILMLLVADQSLRSGQLTPSGLLSVMLYAALLTQPVGALAQSYGQLQIARGTLARLHVLLGREPEAGYTAFQELRTVRGDISFRNVSFGYSGRAEVLRGFNLEIHGGEVVALVGDNGAGKTTVVNLLLRFYEPSAGTVLLDGRDIASIQVQDLRRQIGLVPQRPLLFNGTIRANIAYGDDAAGPPAIEDAARLAQAHEFIMRLPRGYETEIGDHGVRLSGGQRQRIALARALLKDPPVLVLDEATSMYDPDGESAFIAACATALEGRTVIIITHRPASLALATRMIRIHDSAAEEFRAETPGEPGSVLGG